MFITEDVDVPRQMCYYKLFASIYVMKMCVFVCRTTRNLHILQSPRVGVVSHNRIETLVAAGDQI